jgi:hypothetical protein
MASTLLVSATNTVESSVMASDLGCELVGVEPELLSPQRSGFVSERKVRTVHKDHPRERGTSNLSNAVVVASGNDFAVGGACERSDEVRMTLSADGTRFSVRRGEGQYASVCRACEERV